MASTVERSNSDARRARVDVVFNPSSGRGNTSEDLDAIRAELEKGFERVRVWETTPECGAEARAREALEDGGRVLVASGGDGTVAGVAAALRGVSGASIGVIPRGTANAFCAALDVPADLKAACAMVLQGNVRVCDMGRVVEGGGDGPKDMLLLCGVGLEAQTVRAANRKMKKAWGVLAYAIAGIKSMRKQTWFRTDIVLHSVDDSLAFAGGRAKAEVLNLKNMKLKGVTIANAAPATSVLAQGIGEVRPDDGLLEVVCIAPSSFYAMFRAMLSMLQSALLRKRVRRADVFGLRATRVEITCHPEQMVVIDGEEAGFTPITIEINDSGKVGVIAPKAGTVTRKRRRLSRSLIRLWRNLRGVTVLTVAIGVLNQAYRKRS